MTEPSVSLPLNPRASSWGFGAIALAATLWGLAAIVARNLLDAGVGASELAAARAILTFVSLALLMQTNRTPVYLMKSGRWISWKTLALGVSLALVTACYYVAIARLSVAVALVIQYTAPALVVLFKACRSRRPPSRPVVLALITALLGVSLITGLFSQSLSLNPVGLVAASLAALFFASYTLLSESIVETYGAMGVMLRGFLVASLFWIAFQFTQPLPQALFALENLPGILFVCIGGTLIPFCLMCWGIQQVSAEKGAIAATLEPAIAALLAWIWLKQTLTLVQIVGGVLVLGAVLLLQTSRPSNQP